MTEHTIPKLYLEDLEVGQVFCSNPKTLTQDEIQNFARQFDPQPFHLDPALAADSFFKQLVASGWHTASTTMRLMVESIPIAGGLIGAGVTDIRWHLPVLPNDSLSVTSEILSVKRSKSQPHQGFVQVQHTTLNQRQQTVQSCISTIVVPSATHRHLPNETN